MDVKDYCETVGNELAAWKAIDSRPTPAWWRDAKFGIYTHWGPYSVPAYGPNGTWYSNRPTTSASPTCAGSSTKTSGRSRNVSACGWGIAGIAST